jgi:eukaryotic translation initiation factor 2C
MELFKSLQENVAPTIFTAPASYDGRKNVFSMYKLQLGPTDSREVRVPTCTNYTLLTSPAYNFLFIQFNVSLPRQGPPPAPGGRPPKIYKMKLTIAAEINTEYDLLILTCDQVSDLSFRLLHRFIEGKQSQDPAVLTAIMVSCVGYFKYFSHSLVLLRL